MLAQIGQIALPVHDLERAVKFYRDILGMRYLFQAPNLAFFDCGGIRLMLGLPETPDQDRPGSVIYFKVADIQSAHQTLTSRGVQFIRAPHLIVTMKDHDLWLAFFRDEDQNNLALMSEVPRS